MTQHHGMCVPQHQSTQVNGSYYECNCFNLIWVLWIIMCKKFKHFVFTANCLQISSQTATNYWTHDAVELLHQKLA